MTVSAIDKQGLTGKLVLDSNENPHVAYIGSLDAQHGWVVKYASYNAQSSIWTVRVIDSSEAFSPASIELALDLNNKAHIIYTGASQMIKYAIIDSSSTKVSNVFSGVNGPLVIDSHGNPQLLYRQDYPKNSGNNSTLSYSVWNGTAWNTQNIISGVELSGVGFLALDKRDNPQINYFLKDPNYPFSGQLVYTQCIENNWVSQVVDTNATGPASMALDSHNQPHLSYPGPHPSNSYYAASCMYATTSLKQSAANPTDYFTITYIAISIIITIPVAVSAH